MVVHLAAFGNAAARDGLAAVPPLTPDALEPLGSYNGNNFQIARPTTLLGAAMVTETIATMLSWRLKKSTDPNWMNFNMGMKADDTAIEPDVLALIGSMNRAIKANEILQAEADNTNTSALDTIGMWFGAPGDISPVPLPFNEVVEGQATGTLVVDTWTDVGTITWSHVFVADRTYKIVGMGVWSATGHLARLNLLANAILQKPGCIAGTTRLAGNHIIWGNLGSFKGTNPPGCEVVANTADTAETITLFLQ